MHAAGAWTRLLSGFKFYPCVSTKHLFWGPASVVLLPFSVTQETRSSQGLSSVTRQSRQQRPCSDLLPPKPGSSTIIKTKPQLFIRGVWELFFLWTSESCQCQCPPPCSSPSAHQLACFDLSHTVYSQRERPWKTFCYLQCRCIECLWYSHGCGVMECQDMFSFLWKGSRMFVGIHVKLYANSIVAYVQFW